MISELARPAGYEPQRSKQIINIIQNHIMRDYVIYKILDVGEYNGITNDIENCYNKHMKEIIVDNTKGDLDGDFVIPNKDYDIILMSHIIEHIFNPLHALLKLKEVLSDMGIMIIALPQRPKFLWWDGHYHEIDHYRMKLLLKRAGLKIVNYEKHRVWRKPLSYLLGIRPLIRLFFKTNSVYKVSKRSE